METGRNENNKIGRLTKLLKYNLPKTQVHQVTSQLNNYIKPKKGYAFEFLSTAGCQWHILGRINRTGKRAWSFSVLCYSLIGSLDTRFFTKHHLLCLLVNGRQPVLFYWMALVRPAGLWCVSGPPSVAHIVTNFCLIFHITTFSVSSIFGTLKFSVRFISALSCSSLQSFS